MEKRYFFVEVNRHYGQRILGRLAGYKTQGELIEDCETQIKYNKETKTPCFIAELRQIKNLL